MAEHEFARSIAVPYEADAVLPPTIMYGERLTLLAYTASDDSYIRVTFEKLDAIKVCGGEVLPFPIARLSSDLSTWAYVIEHSRWLQERYRYEAENYGDQYDWGNDVDEMLTDYNHYLFSFHDEFVEVIAAGIWFERSEAPLAFKLLPIDYPLNDLPDSAIIERFSVENIICQIRANPRPVDSIVAAAHYCSQPLFHFALELDDTPAVSYRLDLRVRDGNVRSTWRNSFGRLDASFEGIATLAQARALIEPYIHEVAGRRRKMGR